MIKIPVMAAVAAITFSSATAHAQSASTPSLGEVARQTAAKRASTRPTNRIYTNASLEAVPEEVITSAPLPPVAAPAPSSTPGTSSTDQTATKPAPAGNVQATTTVPAEDENAWRQEAAKHRRDLDEARAALEKVRKASTAGTEAQNRNAQRQLDQAQRTLEYLEKRWEAYRKSAEVAKVPPAWLEPSR